jgi:hypothetical protein
MHYGLIISRQNGAIWVFETQLRSSILLSLCDITWNIVGLQTTYICTVQLLFFNSRSNPKHQSKRHSTRHRDSVHNYWHTRSAPRRQLRLQFHVDPQIYEEE